MHDRRVGLAIRELRRRRGWTQTQLGALSGVAQTEISKLERGHVASTSARVLRRVCGPLEADVEYELRWRAGALDRLLDRNHAFLVEAVVELLRDLGWQLMPEVSFAHYGDRGSIDILAWRDGQLLVVEVKSTLESIEETLRRLDVKVRLAASIAHERFAIRPRTVSVLLVLGEGTTARRRVAGSEATFSAGFPARGWSVRRWLREPVGQMRGLLFLPFSTGGARKRCSAPARGPKRPEVAPGSTTGASR